MQPLGLNHIWKESKQLGGGGIKAQSSKRNPRCQYGPCLPHTDAEYPSLQGQRVGSGDRVLTDTAEP